MKLSQRTKIIITITIIAILIISGGYYYFKVRPDAAREFRRDIRQALENLNSIFSSFYENKTPENPGKHFENASQYFSMAADNAGILLIPSEPYSKLAELSKSLAEKIRENEDFIYAIWNVWNTSDGGFPFRSIYRWVMWVYQNTTLWDFVDNMKNTNWDTLIEFLEEIIING